ncbi:MAG: inositol monophosphatase family protein [Planctomycetota bacterium]
MAMAHLDGRGETDGTVEFKGRRELVTAADKAAENVLVDGIRERFPAHAILAEEGVQTPAGKAHQTTRSAGSSTRSTGRPTTSTGTRSGACR